MTCSVAMAPPAPGRLSMTKCCRGGPPSAVEKVRPIRSAAPPAELGMTSRIGFVGQSAAPAEPPATSIASSAAYSLIVADPPVCRGASVVYCGSDRNPHARCVVQRIREHHAEDHPPAERQQCA